MLPTPSTSHVNYDHIYEPSEDSYLLLDTLSSDSERTFIQAQCPPSTSAPLVLEVGPGSGVVLAFVTAHAEHIFGRPDIATLGVDVNYYACIATKQTVELAVKGSRTSQTSSGHFLDTVCGDLTSAIKPKSVDVLIFNPPYVPSESIPDMPNGEDRDVFHRDLHLSLLATDGGMDGMEITNRLFGELPSVLSQRGVAYVLLCAQNKPEAVIVRIRNWPCEKQGSWRAEKVGCSGKKAGWETLCVIRIWRDM